VVATGDISESMVGMMGVARARAVVLMIRRGSFMVKTLIDIVVYCDLVVRDEKEKRKRKRKK
jgi:hypothetical protein